MAVEEVDCLKHGHDVRHVIAAGESSQRRWVERDHSLGIAVWGLGPRPVNALLPGSGDSDKLRRLSCSSIRTQLDLATLPSDVLSRARAGSASSFGVACSSFPTAEMHLASLVSVSKLPPPISITHTIFRFASSLIGLELCLVQEKSIP